MNPVDLRNQLLQAKGSRDFISETESITANLKDEDAGLESVTVILKFMEENPDFDFGTPGPLVHFIETFYRRGYEAELLASIARRPTIHTISLLNALINGTKQVAEREKLITALSRIETHSQADDEVKRLATRYLQRLSS